MAAIYQSQYLLTFNPSFKYNPQSQIDVRHSSCNFVLWTFQNRSQTSLTCVLAEVGTKIFAQFVFIFASHKYLPGRYALRK